MQPVEGQFGLGKSVRSKLVGEDQLFAGLRTKSVFRRRYFIKAVGDLGRERDGPIAGDGPWRRGPDDDGRRPNQSRSARLRVLL